MAAPVDAGRTGTAGSTAAVNKVCNLPASLVGGDILVLILRSAGADTHTTPTDWTDLVKNDASDASDDTTSIFWKVATGDEGATVTVNGTASLKFAAHAWRVTGGSAGPAVSTIVTGSSTDPDPGSLSPAGGSKEYLWFWLGGWEGEQTSPPAGNPTNYSNPVGASSGTAGLVATNCRVAGATRQNTTATEDPPSWTISASDDWSAWTVAISPMEEIAKWKPGYPDGIDKQTGVVPYGQQPPRVIV